MRRHYYLYLMKTLALLLMMMWVAIANAQDVESWQQYFSDLGQMEDAESDSWEETYEALDALYHDKLDLNSCTREELERLPFLSAQQVMDIMEYRDRAGRIESMVELRMVPSLRKTDVDMLSQFVTLSPEGSSWRLPPLDSIVRHGRHEVAAAIKIPFYDRDGDRNGYLGYKYKHWLRYTFSYGQRVKVGLVASQDAGEPFFAGRNRWGYDYYSLYFQLRRLGRLKTLVVGRYRLRFGMGLAMNTSFGLGKLNTLATLGASANHVVGHSSRSEANYLQGAAATVTLCRGLDVTAFASWRKIDATLNDSTGGVRTILTSGYHRTPSEMARRRNTQETVAGGNLNFFRNGFHVGLTAFGTFFDRALDPNTSQPYRRWYPRGKQFWNASVDYGYVSGRLNITGETATGDCGTVATLNTVSYLLTPSFSLMALQRYYPYQYYSLFSMSYADGGAVNNESGLYLGGQWSPSQAATVLFYADVAYFAWAKYQASAASHSQDYLVQLTGERHRWSYLLRMRVRRRERDNAATNRLDWRDDYRARAALGYDDGTWALRTQADMSIGHQQETSRGYMVTQQAGWQRDAWKAFVVVGYFNTDDYYSRIYTYERGLSYNFSYPMFAGEGLRYAALLRADVSSHLVLMAKVGTTNYFRSVSSASGLNHIDRHSRTDLELQVKWRL